MPSDDTEYAETMSTFRHYSNLRFAELTLFTATTGGVGTWAYTYMAKGPVPAFIVAADIVMTLIFIGLEVTLQGYMNGLREYILRTWPNSHMSHTPRWARPIPPKLFLIYYFAAFVFWTFLPFIPRP